MDYVVHIPAAMAGHAVTALCDAVSNSIGPLLGGGDGPADDSMTKAADEYLGDTGMFFPNTPGHFSSQAMQGSDDDLADPADKRIPDVSTTGESLSGQGTSRKRGL